MNTYQDTLTLLWCTTFGHLPPAFLPPSLYDLKHVGCIQQHLVQEEKALRLRQREPRHLLLVAELQRKQPSHIPTST